MTKLVGSFVSFPFLSVSCNSFTGFFIHSFTVKRRGRNCIWMSRKIGWPKLKFPMNFINSHVKKENENEQEHLKLRMNSDPIHLTLNLLLELEYLDSFMYHVHITHIYLSQVSVHMISFHLISFHLIQHMCCIFLVDINLQQGAAISFQDYEFRIQDVGCWMQTPTPTCLTKQEESEEGEGRRGKK